MSIFRFASGLSPRRTVCRARCKGEHKTTEIRFMDLKVFSSLRAWSLPNLVSFGEPLSHRKMGSWCHCYDVLGIISLMIELSANCLNPHLSVANTVYNDFTLRSWEIKRRKHKELFNGHLSHF